MSEEERHTIKLQPRQNSETNSLHLEPEQMRKWLYKSPAEIKKQLTENGNTYATFISYTQSTYQKLCTAKSEMNPANYAAKMVSNLLRDYVDPTKKSDIQRAQIDKRFIQDVIDCSEQCGLTQGVNTDNTIANELAQSIRNVRNTWERQKEHEKNLALSASVALELRLLGQQKMNLTSLDAEEARRTQEKIEYEENRCYKELQELQITPQEAFVALKQKERDEYNKAREEDQKGQEKRTAAVQRGTIITTYDPKDKDEFGYYYNIRHYRTNKDGSLTPVSRDTANELLRGEHHKKGANHESSIDNGTKLDISYLRYAEINYRGH